MLYEGALIVRFEKALGETGTRLMADLGKRALKVDRFDGVEIVEFRDMLENDLWTSYIAMPAADLLVVATNRPYRGTAAPAKNSNRGASPAREPSGVAMGGCRCAVLGLRHYRPDAPKDPTSPFSRPNVVGGFDDAAVGVTAHVKSDGRTIVAHYVSPAAVAEQTAKRLWYRPGDGVSPAFRRVGANAIEARLVAKDEEDLAMFFFYLLATLGHATFL